MKRFSMSPRTVILASIAVVVAVGCASAVYASVYRLHSEGPVVRAVAETLPLPAAKVGSGTVTYGEYLVHADALRRYLAGPAAAANGIPSTPTEQDLSNALERAIRIEAVEQFAEERGLMVTPIDVERTYADLVARAGTSTTPGEIESLLLNQFGWSVDEFKSYVLRPAILEDALRLQMGSETGNPTAFDEQLAARLQSDYVKRYIRFD